MFFRRVLDGLTYFGESLTIFVLLVFDEAMAVQYENVFWCQETVPGQVWVLPRDNFVS